MTSKTEDGGPAFPSTAAITPDGDVIWPEYGMSLRDWFAGQALTGICAGAFGTNEGAERLKAVCLSGGANASSAIAIMACGVATAMIKEREK